MFFDSHFFTMLMYRSPIDFSTKVLDVFLYEGEGTNFTYIFSVSYGTNFKNSLVKSKLDSKFLRSHWNFKSF